MFINPTTPPTFLLPFITHAYNREINSPSCMLASFHTREQIKLIILLAYDYPTFYLEYGYRCDSSGDLYPVTEPLSLPSALMSLSPSTWHQRLGHPCDVVLHSLVSRNFISCKKEKSPHVCHACQLGKHAKLPFSNFTSIVSKCFEIIHSDIWTSPIDDEEDEDDDMDIEADEEEEEHPAPTDSVVVASTAADQAPSAEETEPFETDESESTPPPHPAYCMTARISILAPVPMPSWTDSKIVRLLAMSSPPASPLSPWSSPPPQIPFPPLPPILSPPSPVLSPAPPLSPIRSLGYRAAMIRLRDETASTSSPPLQLPSASRMEDRPEVTLPPQKRLGITLGPRYEVGESSSAAGARPAGGLKADYGFVATMDREIMRDPEREVSYGITDSWDEIVETLQGEPVSTDTELGGYMREFETRVRQDTDEIYMRLDDEQTKRQLLAGQLNMLFRDRRAHAYTRHLMETEARMRRTVILELLRTDHRRSTEITELRTALQGQVTAIQGQKQMAPKRTTRSTADQETINTTMVTNAQLHAMIDQGANATLAARDALRSTNGDDSHNSGSGVRRTERATRECTYTDFLNNCAAKNQVKFATCTLHSVALTWWNTHVQTVGHEAAYGMSWKTLMKMMTEKYCPRNEIRKLEMELWDLKVRGTDLASYTQRYQELALLCGRIFSEESDKIEKYIGGLPDMIHGSVVASKNTANTNNANNQRGTGLGQKDACYECGESDKIEKYVRGLPDMIHGSVVASKPKTMQEAIEIATGLMDKKIRTFAERETASKRKGLPDMIHGSVVASKPKTMQEAIEIATGLMDKKIRTFAERETASKRKYENTSRNTQNQQQQHSNKRQNTGRVYTVTSGEKKQYGGSKTLCAKCNYHHDGPCAPKCRNCSNIGHFVHDCKSAANINNANYQRGTGSTNGDDSHNSRTGVRRTERATRE
nr:reverse transcriptase domain-containing protein [Tanacetum cinerariifolium]